MISVEQLDATRLHLAHVVASVVENNLQGMIPAGALQMMDDTIDALCDQIRTMKDSKPRFIGGCPKAPRMYIFACNRCCDTACELSSEKTDVPTLCPRGRNPRWEGPL